MKKGFTLIELLGVIIVLSVIALITVPMVLDVVDEARVQANTATAYGYLEAAKLYKTESIFDEVKQLDIDYVNNIYSKIVVKGNKPENGELYINKNGESALAVVLDDKCYYKAFYEELTIKEEGECTLGWVGVDEEVPTLTAKEENVVIEAGTTVDVKSYFNEPTYGPSGGTLSCDIEDTSLLEIGKHVITCTAQGTNGKTTVATKTITVDYQQLINYTMLYDAGDECTSITGGINAYGYTSMTGSGYSYSSSNTKNADNIYISDNSSLGTTSDAIRISTVNSIDFTGYTKMIAKTRLITNQTYGAQQLLTVVSEDLAHKADTFNHASDSIYMVDYHQGYNDITSFISLDLNLNESKYPTVSLANRHAYALGSVTLYNWFLVKADNWQELCSIAEVSTPASLSELLSNSTAISSILANEDAVRYMIKQCTGDFMYSAITNTGFKTALESSTYKDLVYANTHWAKFLNMVQ